MNDTYSIKIGAAENMTSLEISNQTCFNELFLHNQNSNRQIYVDVGGYDGDTVTKALGINPNLRIIVIEPIKSLCELMKQKFANNPNVTVVNKAAWSKKQKIQFNEYQGWSKGLSTVQEKMTELRPQGIFADRIDKYEIEADTLDNILLEKFKQYVNIDYIKIDAEGSEEQVLEGFSKFNNQTRFHIESHIINLENILLKLLELGSSIEKVTLFRDANIPNHVVGAVIGTFGTNKKANITEIKSKLIKPLPEIEKFTFPDGPRRVEFLIENAIKNNKQQYAVNAATAKDKILNIGCADCFGFRDLDLDVTNVDIKDEVPPEYKSRAKFQIADAHNLQFSDKQFNCAILGDILEHVRDPVQVLKEAKRVAKNVYVTVPNEYEWHKDLKPFENPGHVRFYTHETLKEDLDKGLGENTYKVVQYNGAGWSFFCVTYETEHIIEVGPIIRTTQIQKQCQTANCCQLNITTGPIPGPIPPLNISNDTIPKKLRIALISTPFFTIPPTGYSGLEMVVWDLAMGLDELGHIVTIFGPKGSKATPHGKLVVTGPSYDTVNIDWFQAEKNAYNIYKNIINENDYDIIHSHEWFGHAYILKTKYPNLKVISTHHGGYSWQSPPNW